MSQHYFLYVAQGSIFGYDRDKQYVLKAGESCIIRKNHLARYRKQREKDEFAKVIIAFDETFLREFCEKHRPGTPAFTSTNAFIQLKRSPLILDFLHSLGPWRNIVGKSDDTNPDRKREELLTILLRSRPELAGVFFDFGAPQKIDLEAFMNQNYKFNVSIERFAFLTGRSRSAFKRDFKQVFNDTPSHWLIQRRLEEAHFLLEKKKTRTSDVYQEVGFEDLSHFSFAFKKRYGYSPVELQRQKNR